MYTGLGKFRTGILRKLSLNYKIVQTVCERSLYNVRNSHVAFPERSEISPYHSLQRQNYHRLPCLNFSRLLCRMPYNSVNHKSSKMSRNDHILLDQENQITYIVRGMAGHSKWQNIRHIKSKRDNERARTIDRMVRLIRLAVKDAGLSDPKQSSKVASAVEEARDNNVPMATIENALKSGQLEKDKLLAATLEIVGLGGSFLVVDILSPNAIKTKNILKPVLKKHGATYAQSSVMSSFDHKGVILAKKDGQTMEGALEDAIEVGAEEVTESSEEEEKLLQFMCDVPSFHVVKTGLKERGYTLHQAGLEYIPTARVKLSELELTIMDKFCHMLEENEHVVKIYDNIE